MSNYFESPNSDEMILAKSLNNQLGIRPATVHVDEGLEKISFVLDQLFRIPGTNIRFGLDPIIGFLLPFAGDSISTLISMYIVLRSIQYGLPKIVIGRMVFNVGFDYLVGSVPVVGDFFDFAFQANKKNVELLNRFAEGKSRSSWSDYLWLFMLLGLLGGFILAWLFFIVWTIKTVSGTNSLFDFLRITP
jgi:hypothetical protein